VFAFKGMQILTQYGNLRLGRSRDGSLICFKDKTRKRKSSIAASVFSSGWRIILFRAKLSFVPSLEFLRYSV
jgi:hypothetical protein